MRTPMTANSIRVVICEIQHRGQQVFRFTIQSSGDFIQYANADIDLAALYPTHIASIH